VSSVIVVEFHAGVADVSIKQIMVLMIIAEDSVGVEP
jgi:hypothetical protein